MANGLSITTGLFAIIGIAPWAVFLGGLAKLTDVVTDYEWSQVKKQHSIMLEWYLVSANFVYFVLVAILAFGRSLNRTHSFLTMFLAVNTALLIIRATDRIQGITLVKNLDETIEEYLGVEHLQNDPLPFLQALAAGEISTAGWNFLLAILVGIAGTDVPLVAKNLHGQPQQVITA